MVVIVVAMVARVGRGRGYRARVGYDGDSLAEDAADGLCARRKLQWGMAV